MLHLDLDNEANMAREIDHILDQRIDCIYGDDHLGFEKTPSILTEKIQTHVPLEEIDLGDESIKRLIVPS